MDFQTKAKYLAKADATLYRGEPLSKLDHDTLLAICVWLVEKKVDNKDQYRDILGQILGVKK